MLDKDLFYYDLDVASKEELLKRVGSDLVKKGYVKDSYIDAIIEREQAYPTGLPLLGGVAIPHTSIEHANTNKLVFVKLLNPILFHEMGNDEESVSVKFVIFLVINDRNDHMKVLSTIVDIIQDEKILENIIQSEDKASFESIIHEKFLIDLGGDA